MQVSKPVIRATPLISLWFLCIVGLTYNNLWDSALTLYFIWKIIIIIHSTKSGCNRKYIVTETEVEILILASILPIFVKISENSKQVTNVNSEDYLIFIVVWKLNSYGENKMGIISSFHCFIVSLFTLWKFSWIWILPHLLVLNTTQCILRWCFCHYLQISPVTEQKPINLNQMFISNIITCPLGET